jgi:8-oxo-dGTP pyrophosphatase MutT (NUDIX family)
LLRAKLQEALPGKLVQERMSPNIRTSLNFIHEKPLRQSAVMLLLYPKNGELYLAYFKRPEYDGPHSGQIAFPGGKAEIQDATILETALRETKEEFGIEPEMIDVLGALTNIYIPVSNMDVSPFVGFLTSAPNFIPNTDEVNYIIELPISILLDDNAKKTETKFRHGMEIETPMYVYNKEEIWGATAMITSEFEEILRSISIHL